MPKPERILAVPERGEIPLGVRLRALRWHRRMTAEELGIAAGASVGGPFDRSHVSHVEVGRVRPSDEFLAGAARALDITVDALLGASHDDVLAWMAAGPPGSVRTVPRSRGRRGRRSVDAKGQSHPDANNPLAPERSGADGAIPGLAVDVTVLLTTLAQLPPALQERCLHALLPVVEAIRDTATGA